MSVASEKLFADPLGQPAYNPDQPAAEVALELEPFDPLIAESPLPDDMREQMDDVRLLNEKYNRGELHGFRGNYVVLCHGQLLGHGPDLSALRKEWAQKASVPESRLVVTFVY